jgi:menaquinone-dependent protoporphyrinogen oxidase
MDDAKRKMGVIMCEVPIFYATSEGQTRLIAVRIAGRIREHGLDARAVQIGTSECDDIDWTHVRGVGLGASIHMQKHQPLALTFARARATTLTSYPSIFFSVSLAAASKDPGQVAAVRRIAEEFVAQSGWTPGHIACVAGRLAYSKYNWLTRFVMRRIAIKEGGSPDTSRDHEYTDWVQVRDLADTLANEIRALPEPHALDGRALPSVGATTAA